MYNNRISACVLYIATQAANTKDTRRSAYAPYVDKPSYKNLFSYGDTRQRRTSQFPA